MADILSIDPIWIGHAARTQTAPLQALSEKLATQEKDLIEAALAESRGKVSSPSGAAARLRIPQSTLDSKSKTLKIIVASSRRKNPRKSANVYKPSPPGLKTG